MEFVDVGNDRREYVSTQYRPAIFPQTNEQREIADRVIARVSASGRWQRPITTSIEPARPWYRAEVYHQDYLRKHPGGHTCQFLHKEQGSYEAQVEVPAVAMDQQRESV